MLDEAMLRFVCVFCLVACSEGFVVDDEDVGPDGALDSAAMDAVGDVSAPDDAGSLDAAPSDAGPDASADASVGPFDDPDCMVPWLFFVDPVRATVRRVSLPSGTECAELDGDGELDAEVTSVTIASDVFVVVSVAQIQGLDLRTNTVLWSIPQAAIFDTFSPRTVVVPLEEGFIAAWTVGGRLVEPIRVLDPMGTSESLPIDEYFYDLSAAEDRRSFWGARSPGERARRDLAGERIESRPSVRGLQRIHALGDRVVSVDGQSNILYIDDLSTPLDTAPVRIDPEDCQWLPFALISPMNNNEVIVACAHVGARGGEVASLRIMDGAGETRPLLVVNSVIWDAEIYAP